MGDDGWDEAAQGWDDDPVVRLYAEAAAASLHAELDRRGLRIAGARVLDFGCGTGLLTERLVGSAASVDAVDTSAAMRAVLEAKGQSHGWDTITVTAEVPSDRRWDVIVCSSVCGFLDDYPGTVKQLATALEPGGLFVQWDWESDGTDGHGLTRSEINQALTDAGLDDVDVRTAFSVPFEDQSMEPLMGSGVRRRDTPN